MEVATGDGSVFVVVDGKRRLAATTAAAPTVGLVFYDLKSALRAIGQTPSPTPRKRATPAKKPAARKTAASKPAAKKPTAPRKKKPDAT